jgi:hypothetical protein
MWDLLSVLGYAIYIGWPLVALLAILARSAHRSVLLLARIRAEVRPFYLPSTLLWVCHGIVTSGFNYVHLFNVSLALWTWYVYRDDDDDDLWRRRKRQLTQRVWELSGRLVVAPANA